MYDQPVSETIAAVESELIKSKTSSLSADKLFKFLPLKCLDRLHESAEHVPVRN